MPYAEIITLPSTSQRGTHIKPIHRPAHLQPSSLRPSSFQSKLYSISSTPTPPSSSPSSSFSEPMSYHRNLSQPWRLAPALPVISPPSANPFSPSGQTTRTGARSASEIIPRLLISDLSFAENPALLASHRITHIMSTMPDNIFRPPPSLLPLQPIRMQVKVDDLPFAELAAHLPATTAWIRDALANPDARVLVHCAEGVSRSVSVVAAFLMAQYGWTPMEALGFVKSKRRIAEPNFGFIQQLHEYARDSLGRQVVIPTQPFSLP